MDASVVVASFSIDDGDQASGKKRPTEKLLLLSAFSVVNRLGNDFDSPVELWGRVKPENVAKKTITLQLKNQHKTEEAVVICGDEGFTGNVGPMPAKSEKNRLNSGSEADPKKLPKGIKLVEDLIAEKRKMDHVAMVHEDDVPSGDESAEEKKRSGESSLKTWHWIGIAAVGCAAGVLGGIVAYFYFRE